MAGFVKIEESLFSRFELFGTSIALQYYKHHQLVSVSYTQLKEQVLAAKCLISKLGLQSGDRIGLMSENLAEWAVTYLAAISAELTPVLLDPQATDQDLNEKLSLSDPRAIFVSNHAYPKLSRFTLPCYSIQDEYRCLNDKVANDPGPSKEGDHSIAALIFTSGTTDGYKAVMITHENIVATLDLFATKSEALVYKNHNEMPHYNEDIHLIDFLPWHHVFGLFSTLLLPLHTGFKFTIVDQISPDRIMEVIRENHPTFMFTVPRLIDAIAGQIKKKIENLTPFKQKIIHHLRRCVLWMRNKTNVNIGKLIFKKVHREFGGLATFVAGGAPLNRANAEFLTSLGFTVLEGYGLSESTGTGFARSHHDWNAFGKVGKSIPGLEVQISNPNDEGIGEICLKGPNIMKGYFRNQESTERTIKNGWLLTGDLGRLNPNGMLEITGRIKEMITTSTGKKATPELIKNHYNDIPHIKDMAVIGIRSKAAEVDEIHAVIVSEDDHLNETISHSIHTRSAEIPHHLRIQYIHFKEEILKTPTLKIKIQPIRQFIHEKNNAALKKHPDVSVSEREKEVLNILADIVGHHELNLKTRLSELGLDSLGTLEFINEVKRKYKQDIPLSFIVCNPSVFQICQYLKQNPFNKQTSKLDLTGISRNYKPLFKKDLSTKHVFLTGATGGVGGHLVKTLLEQTTVTIHCLIRSDSQEKARKKLNEILMIYGMNHKQIEAFKDRLNTYLGDIVKPSLGLDPITYETLAKKIDLTIHCAASIQLSGQYEVLKEVNVDGTLNVIDFALKSPQKYFTFISSYSVMGDHLFKTSMPFKESDYNVGQEFHAQGYERTKFEAEGLVRQAADKGLNWQIMRLGNVFGQSFNGVYPLHPELLESMFYNNLKTVIETRQGMEDEHFYDITPVDYISQAILYLTLNYKEIYGTYHLVNPDHKRWSDILNLIESCGIPLERHSSKEYVTMLQERKIRDYKKGEPYRSITTELIKYKNDLFENPGSTYVESDATQSILQAAGVICPKISKNLIKNYINYCQESGYINIFTIPAWLFTKIEIEDFLEVTELIQNSLGALV